MAEIALSDEELFSYCNERVNTLGFLSQETTDVLRELAVRTKNTSLSFGDGPQLVDLWKNLLMDAVHALKSFDAREKAQKKSFPFSDIGARTNARRQNVYGIDSLFRFFDQFTDFEQMLYAGKYYRDHVAHPIRVWLTGIRIIDQCGGIEHVDFEIPSGVAEISKTERWAIWTVIALCHDLGYPLEKAREVTSQIDRMLGLFGNVSTGNYRYSFEAHHQSLIDFMLKAVTSKVVELEGTKKGWFTTVIQAKYHAKFAHSFEEFEHGIVSVLVLIRSLVYFMEMDFDSSAAGALDAEDARQFHIRRQILRSIASHSCEEVYHLKVGTPSFLLIVCDDLQEWGRPTIAGMRHAEHSEDTAVKITECDLDGNKLSYSIVYPANDLRVTGVLESFRRFHKLLRPALDDNKRQIKFTRRVANRDGSDVFVFDYDSDRPPFQELRATHNESDCIQEVFGWKHG